MHNENPGSWTLLNSTEKITTVLWMLYNECAMWILNQGFCQGDKKSPIRQSKLWNNECPRWIFNHGICKRAKKNLRQSKYSRITNMPCEFWIRHFLKEDRKASDTPCMELRMLQVYQEFCNWQGVPIHLVQSKLCVTYIMQCIF